MNLTKQFWGSAYKKNASKMLGVCYRYVQDKAIAEDLMQDAFMTAMKKADSYSGKGSFDGWLRKIAVNTALMYLRSEKTKNKNFDLIGNEHVCQNIDEPNPNNIRAVVEHAQFTDMELLEIIHCLPEHHRLVFNLYVLDDYTHAQIGEKLNISIGTSKSHLARARKKMQQLLHQKALKKIRMPKRTARASLIMFFTYKSDYIDTLYKTKVKAVFIEPRKGFDVIFDSIKWNGLSTPQTMFPIYSFKSASLALWGVIGGVASIVVLSIFLGLKPSTISEIEQVSKKEMNNNEQIMEIPQKKKQRVEDTVEKLPQMDKKEEPVIIRKKIVKRKTVIIRDTITIRDSTYGK